MFLELFGGLVYLLLAGDLLVRGAVALAEKARVPPMVVGLTIVAFGTSAPELCVSVGAALTGHAGIAIGNVVGSNIANVLLVLGLPAVIFPTLCNQRTVTRHCTIVVLASVLFAIFCLLGPLGRIQGAVMLVLMGGVLLFSAREARGAPGGEEAAEELERVLGLPHRKRMIALFLALGVVGLPLGADLVVEGAVEIAHTLGISEAVIGLSVIAIGTSLPELATTLVAAFHRHADVAVGTVLGSNVFNILAIMGTTAFVSPAPLAVPPSVLRFDLIVMVATALILLHFARTGRIGRGWGAALVTVYALYLVLLFRPPPARAASGGLESRPMTYSRIEVRPVSGVLGAEVDGIELAKPLDEETFAELHRAFLAHGVLFFRGQHLAPADQLSFARRLGEAEVHPIVAGTDAHPEVIRVWKPAGESASFGVGWHTDNSFFERPSRATLLYGETIPPYGGDTLFASMERAYEALSAPLRGLLDGLRAVHSASRAYDPANVGAAKYRGEAPLTYRWSDAIRDEVEHPVIRTHPETGRRSIYVNPMFTQRIAGLPPPESDALLAFLYAHGARPDFGCRLRWQPGSVALWDNRCLWHYALDDYRDFERVMHRVTIAGDRPV
jgi:K+-dependent Na+/Ca+ exchanger-like protein